jgi:hypothetical protein
MQGTTFGRRYLQVILRDTIFPGSCSQVWETEYISVGSGATLGVFGAKRVGGHAVHPIGFLIQDELYLESACSPSH